MRSQFKDVVDPVVFNLGSTSFVTFVVHFRFQSESEELFSKFTKSLSASFSSDFPDEIKKALKTSVRPLMQFPDFLPQA